MYRLLARPGWRRGWAQKSLPTARFATAAEPQDQAAIALFLKKYGLEQHAGVFTSWQSLATMKSPALREAGVNVKDRKKIHRAVELWRVASRLRQQEAEALEQSKNSFAAPLSAPNKVIEAEPDSEPSDDYLDVSWAAQAKHIVDKKANSRIDKDLADLVRAPPLYTIRERPSEKAIREKGEFARLSIRLKEEFKEKKKAEEEERKKNPLPPPPAETDKRTIRLDWKKLGFTRTSREEFLRRGDWRRDDFLLRLLRQQHQRAEGQTADPWWLSDDVEVDWGLDETVGAETVDKKAAAETPAQPAAAETPAAVGTEPPAAKKEAKEPEPEIPPAPPGWVREFAASSLRLKKLDREPDEEEDEEDCWAEERSTWHRGLDDPKAWKAEMERLGSQREKRRALQRQQAQKVLDTVHDKAEAWLQAEEPSDESATEPPQDESATEPPQAESAKEPPPEDNPVKKE